MAEMTFCGNTDCEFNNIAYFRGCSSPQVLNVLLCPGYRAVEEEKEAVAEQDKSEPEKSDRENLKEFLFRTKEIKAEEKDPNGIQQHEPGAKLDDGKLLAGLLLQWSRALTEVLKVSTFGANKYSRGGWQHVKNGPERYTDAMFRHLLKEPVEDLDPDSGLLHAAHAAWNTLSRLELLLREKETQK